MDLFIVNFWLIAFACGCASGHGQEGLCTEMIVRGQDPDESFQIIYIVLDGQSEQNSQQSRAVSQNWLRLTG